MPKLLCPHCGTTNNVGPNPFARCGKCRKRLPLRLPRSITYAARTVFPPLILFGLIILVVTAVPAYRAIQEARARYSAQY